MKYYIKTFGCQMNFSDSERIASFLESLSLPNSVSTHKQKFRPSEKMEKADLVVFNTCGVRQTAEDRALGQIHNLRKAHPEIKIILTGCLAYRLDVQKKLKDKVDLFCEIKNFPQEVERWLTLSFSKNRSSIMNAFEKNSSLDYLSIFPKYSSPLQAYVPIITGCNNFCSYCVVPYARGREISRPVEEIISEINQLAKKNYQTITLLGQNVNSYQYTLSQPNYFLDTKIKVKNINFPKLLDYLASNYPTINFKFISSHPKDFSDELIKTIAQHKNISREIHLPLQSGSDDILRAMNRPYTQKHYLTLIKKILAFIPKASFTTDVIVGFPGETEEQFQETVSVFKKIHYNEAYINKYSPRPGTASYSLGDPIPWEEKKRRARILRKLVHPLH